MKFNTCTVLTQVLAKHSTQWYSTILNSLRPRQNGRLFVDDTFKRIFLNENIRISTKSSLKFVPKGLINNIPALVLIMAWRWPGDKPLSEPMLVRSLTHICMRHSASMSWLIQGIVCPLTLLLMSQVITQISNHNRILVHTWKKSTANFQLTIIIWQTSDR